MCGFGQDEIPSLPTWFSIIMIAIILFLLYKFS